MLLAVSVVGSSCSRAVPGLGHYAGGELCRSDYSGELAGPGAPDKVTIEERSAYGQGTNQVTYNLHNSEDVRSAEIWLKAANLVSATWCWEGGK